MTQQFSINKSLKHTFLSTLVVVVAMCVTTVIAGTSPAGAQSATAVSNGTDSACAITNKKVRCWGSNADGILGNNSTHNSSTPVDVYTKAPWVETIPAHCVNGVVIFGNCIGIGAKMEPARTEQRAASPLYGKTVSKVSVGKTHTCAIASARVYCWGNNDQGQLGTNNRSGSTVPVAVITEKRTPANGLTNKEVIDISAGNNFTCALASDNTVACWGQNDRGQLGNNTRTRSLLPVAVTTGSGSALEGRKVKKLAVLKGDVASMCAITTDDQGVCWGRNDFGEVGDGRTIAAQNITASGQGYHTKGGRCSETNSQAKKEATGKLQFSIADVLKPVLVATGQRFAEIEITGRGDGITVSSASNSMTNSNSDNEGYTYVTGITTGVSTTADKAFYWGGSYKYSVSTSCTINSDMGGQQGQGSQMEWTKSTATVDAYQFGRSIPAGPLYANDLAHEVRNQSLASISGNGYVGGNYEQLKQCLSRTEYSWFGLVSKVVTACTSEPKEAACAVLQTKRDGVYCDNGKVCTSGGWFQQPVCTTNGSTAIASGGTSWLQPGMNIIATDSATSGFSCALANSTIGCWGENGKGQLGDGTTADKTVPVKVKNL